jgi:L-ascorbate metabolism protein UlaG (beta-lactamase superfamily)
MANSATIGQVEIIRYVQSTVKLKTAGKIVWIDPFMVNAEHIGNDKADLILLTHEHGDHFSLDGINAVSKEGTELIINNSGIDSKVRGNVSANLTIMKEGDTSSQAGLDIRAVAGYNNFHPRNDGHNSFNVGFIFGLGGAQILHCGDTDLIEEFNSFGALDIAMLPIGGSGYTMDEADAAKAITDSLKPGVAIPIHYGFATGGDPEQFKQLVGSAAQVEILDALIQRG